MSWKSNPGKLREILKSGKEEALLSILQRIGIEAVNWAKENGNYTDRTGNLRASIGYMIFRDKNIIEISGKITEEQKSDISSALEVEKGYSLVIFAGMNYAKWVEIKGYTVLSGAFEVSEVNATLKEVLPNFVHNGTWGR